MLYSCCTYMATVGSTGLIVPWRSKSTTQWRYPRFTHHTHV